MRHRVVSGLFHLYLGEVRLRNSCTNLNSTQDACNFDARSGLLLPLFHIPHPSSTKEHKDETILYLNISIITVTLDQRFIGTAKTRNSERGATKAVLLLHITKPQWHVELISQEGK